MELKEDVHFLFQLEHFCRLHRQSLALKLAPYDVTPGQIPLLICLWDQEGVSQKELLQQVDIEQPTLANTLKRMQRDELVKAERDGNDRRKVIYRLTYRGKKAKTVVQAALNDVQSICETNLSVTDIKYFTRILEQMTQRLKQDILDPTLILADIVPEE